MHKMMHKSEDFETPSKRHQEAKAGVSIAQQIFTTELESRYDSGHTVTCSVVTQNYVDTSDGSAATGNEMVCGETFHTRHP